MAIVFWDSEGLLLCEFLEPYITTNSNRYCETLQKLHTAFRRKRRLASSDFYLFEPPKKFFSGKSYANQQELQDAAVNLAGNPIKGCSNYCLARINISIFMENMSKNKQMLEKLKTIPLT